MTKEEFVFSNKPAIRISRHLVFWTLYCTYFYIQSLAPRKFSEFYFSDTYYFAFLNLCCFAPVIIAAVYFFIYFLLPETLKKNRYALFVLSFLLVYLVGTVINYFTAGIFLNNVHYSKPIEPDFQHQLEFGNYNTRWGMIIATVALGIKLSKDWHLQQKENLGILKQKTRTEMQLLKSRIHPELLFRSLGSIYSNIKSGSGNSNSMILSLSDLLSYSLYESEMEFVPLEKELINLRHLISLDQSNEESLLDIQLKIEGEICEKYIAPLILVKLFEDTITILYKVETRGTLKLNINVADQNLFLFLIYNCFDDQSIVEIWPSLISNFRNSFQHHYSGNDHPTAISEQNMGLTMSLTLPLKSASEEINVF